MTYLPEQSINVELYVNIFCHHRSNSAREVKAKVKWGSFSSKYEKVYFPYSARASEINRQWKVSNVTGAHQFSAPRRRHRASYEKWLIISENNKKRMWGKSFNIKGKTYWEAQEEQRDMQVTLDVRHTFSLTHWNV